MPAVLTHKSILLLARRRLGIVSRALRLKMDGTNLATDVEKRIQHLAQKTYEMLSTEPHPAIEETFIVDPLAGSVSKFAVMGSMGPDIPGFSALLRPGQAYVFDTIHKGTPHSAKEMVHASTMDFAMALWRQGERLIQRDITDAGEQAQAKKAMRAYVLGHLAHTAADIVSHPFVNDLEFHLPEKPCWITRLWYKLAGTTLKFTHAGGEGSIDAKVAQQVLGRKNTRSGQDWDVWWPATDEVPEPFFEAYAEALEEVYSLRTQREPRTGFADFEREHAELDPPGMNAAFIKDGYQVYRHGVLSYGYDWGFGRWFGVLSTFFVPLIASPWLIPALPQGSRFCRAKNEEESGERGVYELFLLPLAFSSLGPVVFSGMVAGVTTKGVEGYSTAGLGLSVMWLALSIAILSMTFGDVDLPGALRWTLFFALPVGAGLTFFILFFADKKSGIVPMLHSVPWLVMAAFVVLYMIFVGIARGAGAGDDAVRALWITVAALWSVAMLFLWIWLPFRIRDARIRNEPEEFPAALPHHVRLFDDSTLFRFADGDAPESDPTDLARSHYPTSRRKLLKLWWEGGGKKFIRSDRYGLAFSNDGQTVTQEVRAPLVPTTLADYIAFLERMVPGLKAARAERDDPDHLLPAGATFSDHGDGEETLDDHDKEAAKFKELKESEDESDYVLRHAPRRAQSVRFSRRGPVDPTIDEGNAREHGDGDGYTYIHNPIGSTEASDSLMDVAGDFAALLLMGGASQMLDAADRRVDATTTVDPVRQVFKNWNLDRRRLNEWRMLVAGGALNEKGEKPEAHDPRMLKDTPADWTSPLHQASAADFAQGEGVARELGWVPMFRKWFEASRRSDVDMLSQFKAGTNDPPAETLSKGMAFLFDMPSPAR